MSCDRCKYRWVDDGSTPIEEVCSVDFCLRQLPEARTCEKFEERVAYVAPPKTIPEVLLVMKQVDGGRAVIGVIECPWCGETHFTTQVQCGERKVFCGTKKGKAETPDGYSRVDVIRIV